VQGAVQLTVWASNKSLGGAFKCSSPPYCQEKHITHLFNNIIENLKLDASIIINNNLIYTEAFFKNIVPNQTKVTSCEVDFACLVCPSRGKFFF